METNFICFATLSTGSKHKLTEQQYHQILEASSDEMIQLPTGTVFKKSAVMEIQDIREWEEEQKSFNYGQPYTDTKALGFNGVYQSASEKGREAMMRGVGRAIKEMQAKGQTTEKAEALLNLMETGQKIIMGKYVPKYDHIKDEEGNILKFAWEVMQEAGIN